LIACVAYKNEHDLNAMMKELLLAVDKRLHFLAGSERIEDVNQTIEVNGKTMPLQIDFNEHKLWIDGVEKQVARRDVQVWVTNDMCNDVFISDETLSGWISKNGIVNKSNIESFRGIINSNDWFDELKKQEMISGALKLPVLDGSTLFFAFAEFAGVGRSFIYYVNFTFR